MRTFQFSIGTAVQRKRLAILCFLAVFFWGGTGAFAFTLNVMGVDRETKTETPVAEFKWLVEKDVNFHNDPDAAVPAINPDALGLNFHRSYMPVAASGDETTLLDLDGLDPAEWYFVSVIPKDSSTYTIGGAPVRPGQGEVTVKLQSLPLPAAQISVFVFEDTQPINNAPDLPQEQGLGGFQIIIEEAAGKYGANGGQVSVDVYGNPLGTTYDADGNILGRGDGVIRTNANGVVVIKNLAPAKYGIRIDPPDGQGWVQTSTIEGSKVIDAWVKANEPPYFTEFGPAGHHVEFGFVRPFTDTATLTGGATITGNVVSTHNSRPPDYTFHKGATFPDAWVGLNDMSVGRGKGVYAAPTNGNSAFSIPNVPPGDYQLAIWDTNLDIVFASSLITVNADNTCATPTGCDLGPVAVFDWFSRLQGSVFYDVNEDGFPDPGESKLSSAVNIRWRDGTVYNNTGTDGSGYSFSEVFPFFNWLVAEVDFATMKSTGMTAIVDAGGPVDPADPWSYGRLTPQPQPENGGAPYRTETGEVLTQAFQGFLGQTNVIHWGKANYETAAGENGGISGMVIYKTTRAEPSPEDDVAANHEPGVPRVQVNLYRDVNNDRVIDDLDSSGTTTLADVDNYPFNWHPDYAGSPDFTGAPGPEDVDRNTDTIFDLGDALAVTWTDSWDDSQPDNCPGDPNDPFHDADNDGAGDCYDGLRNYNQVRPGVFDGGYAFPGYNADTGEGLMPGIYIVESVPPPHYEIVRAEDMNVMFGDTYEPTPMPMMAMALAFPLVPPCVGEKYIVGEGIDGYLELFPNEVLHPWYDPESPLYQGDFDTSPVTLNTCDQKQVYLSAGANAAVDFNVFTEVPPAAHVKGFILNDLANEFDPNNPNFGEKFALPFVPVSFRDWTGEEVTRVYSDQYGNYNALVPSTFTANLPYPSGMAPNMLIACMNDPGPIPDPNNPGETITDPHHQPQYTQFCYTFQYMPGTITYLDTPIEPIAAFAGQNQAPLDCEFESGVPVIRTATGNGFVGPYVPGPGETITIQSMGMTPVSDPSGGGVTLRNYGFGDAEGSVALGDVALTINSWADGQITATVPAGAVTGQLIVTRNDGKKSPMGITVTVGLAKGASVIQVPTNVATIQAAIEAAAPGDLVLVGEGYYEELVVMWKPVQLQGAGAHVTVINAVKAPGEKLQNWRTLVQGLVTNGDVDILPGQALAFDPANNEPGFLNTAEGPGILVMAPDKKNIKQGGFVEDPNARIDGFTVRGSDIGGGIYVNGYARYLEISNNRVLNNAGINGGGITVGHPFLGDGPVDAENDGIDIHHNWISQNGSRSGGAGGGISLYTGADGYNVSDCWVCGNFSKGVGGGIGHMGLSDNGRIEENTIIFNQTFNQAVGSRPAGGGIAIEGFSPVAGLTPGAGNVTIDDNLLLGNLAGAGDGGGIELFNVNGQDVDQWGNNSDKWYGVQVTNNRIVNNVAGIAGGGISLKDVAKAAIINNTIANNDSVAVAGELIDPLSGDSTAQPAGVVARAHSAALQAAFGPQYSQTFSNPLMASNIVWHNRSFYWMIDGAGVGGLTPNIPLYRDLAVMGDPGSLTCQNCFLSGDGDPNFVSEYFNTNGSLVTVPENSTPLTSAAVDEGGNYIDVRFGPLTLWDPAAGGALFGDYRLTPGSAAVDTGLNLVPAYPALALDFEEQDRPDPTTGLVDIGADELQ